MSDIRSSLIISGPQSGQWICWDGQYYEVAVFDNKIPPFRMTDEADYMEPLKIEKFLYRRLTMLGNRSVFIPASWMSCNPLTRDGMILSHLFQFAWENAGSKTS